jgi:[ribosomal protein S18]-alanine N-acetyltransferase
VRRLELLAPPAVRSLARPLSRLHRAAFADDPWDPRAILEIAGLAGFFGYVAWEDAEPVGLAFAFGVHGEYEIATLGVVPAWRRAGIGTALLDALCGEIRRRGGRSIVLEVAADNSAAQALYAAGGFVRAGRRRDYYRRTGRTVDAEVLRFTLVAPSSSI